MRRTFSKVKGLGFLLWHSRHEFYHVLLGLLWAWILREVWNEFNVRWIVLSVFSSLLPDIEHLVYWIGYGKREDYTREVVKLLKAKKWRDLAVFIERGHKYNTSLSYHNFYVVVILLGLSLLSFFYDWKTAVIIFGAMVIHFIFDIADDIVTLGYINDNWKRWGRGKKYAHTKDSLHISHIDS